MELWRMTQCSKNILKFFHFFFFLKKDTYTFKSVHLISVKSIQIFLLREFKQINYLLFSLKSSGNQRHSGHFRGNRIDLKLLNIRNKIWRWSTLSIQSKFTYNAFKISNISQFTYLHNFIMWCVAGSLLLSTGMRKKLSFVEILSLVLTMLEDFYSNKSKIHLLTPFP